MEYCIVTVVDGADPTPLATLLNEGWYIVRADATKSTIVYVLHRYVLNKESTPTDAIATGTSQGIPHFGKK